MGPFKTCEVTMFHSARPILRAWGQAAAITDRRNGAIDPT